MNEQYLDRCEDMIQEGSSSFYQAFCGLPSPRREAVNVIYAFCRIIDDSVDEPDKAPYSIHELRQHFLLLDAAEGHFIWPALRWLFRQYPDLNKDPFLRQMEGQCSDLSFIHYTTMEQLERYCYLVAGTVGEMLLPVLREESSAEIIASGIALGKGMQIVNIIRDIGDDHKRGRRYIPLDLMNKHGYTEGQMDRGEVNSSFIELIRELKNSALRWFQQGLADIESYPKTSGMAVELAATFYVRILNAVEANGYDVFTRRAFVSDEEKMGLFLDIYSRYTQPSVGGGIAIQ
ncbi:hypothetical protein PBAT_05430 [Paenibacillus antarcticus]|uniref:Uncharacterized protein n=2 Tax=Paenibacillus antarcticus TaxID=253703 RepID=A0A168QFN6_9BACL|nr:hypothetical protein PBAT_05430 [Paenibacillus antarcticus]